MSMLLLNLNPYLPQQSVENSYLATAFGTSSNGHCGPKSPHPLDINAVIVSLFELT
jgi:hypothetical protein